MGQREGTVENPGEPWLDRKVFLTGHTGFKGGWLALWLASKGAQVRGYSLAPETEPNLFTAVRLGQVMDDVRGDIRDYAELEAAIHDFGPEVVFHLAAQPLVLRSYQDPLGTYSTNVMGTANVLEAVRKGTSVRAVVCVTTDKCYANLEWVWPYRETDHLGGHDPYSSSKACAEIAAAAFRTSYFPPEQIAQHGVALATARAGNVIGGGDWAEFRLVPDLIRGFQSGTAVPIRRPKAIRPWQHVLEPLHGYIMLAERLLDQDMRVLQRFNFGPGEDAAWTVGPDRDRARAHLGQWRVLDTIRRRDGTRGPLLASGFEQSSRGTRMASPTGSADSLGVDSGMVRGQRSRNGHATKDDGTNSAIREPISEPSREIKPIAGSVEKGLHSETLA